MHHGRKVRDRCAALRQDQQQKLRGAVYHDHGLRFLCLVRELALAHPWHDSDAPGLVRRLLGYVIPPARSARTQLSRHVRFSILDMRGQACALPLAVSRLKVNPMPPAPGTIATIISAMGSAYKYDTKAEMFRMAAGE